MAAMDPEQLKRKVSKMLQSCLTSSKDGVLLHHVMKDYELVTGNQIPFRDMGHRSFEEFLKSIPDYVTLARNRDGQTICKAVDNRSYAHMSDLISGQKKGKPKKSSYGSRRGRSSFRGYPRNTPRHYTRPQNKSSSHRTEPVSAFVTSPPNGRRKVVSQRSYETPPRFQRLRQPNSYEEGEETWGCAPPRTVPPPPEAKPPMIQVRLKTYKATLEDYCRQLNIGQPVFRTSMIQGSYVTTISIGTHKGSSYPDECNTEEMAIERASEKLVDSLKLSYSSLPVTSCREVYVRRLEQIVANHPRGLLTKQPGGVEDKYVQLHQERLPQDWTQHLEDGALKLDTALNGTSILLPAKRKMKLPRKRDLPDGHFDIYVCYVASTVNVAVRLVEENNNDFHVMMKDMQAQYQGSLPDFVDVDCESVYAAQVEGEWHRVVPVSSQKNQKVLCYFIDVGDEDLVPVQDLRSLRDQFYSFPPQALHIQLSELEELSAIPEINTYLTQRILDQTLVATVVSYDEESDSYSVQLFDTYTEDDIVINDVVIQQYLSLLPPITLPEMDGVCEAYLCHISDKGVAYLQLLKPYFDVLYSILDRLQERIEEIPPCSSLQCDHIYLAKYSNDGGYYRARMTGASHLSKSEVFFVDLGKQEYVERTAIKQAALLPCGEIIERTPEQTVACQLFKLSTETLCDKRVRKHIEKLAPPSANILFRLCNTTSKIPEVELFKRPKDGGLLISINTIVSVDYDYQKSENSVKLNGRGRGSVNHDSSRVSSPESMTSLSSQSDCVSSLPHEDSSPLTSLTPPPGPSVAPNPLDPVPSPIMPLVNQFLDVHVTLAANPGNFTVQPYKDQHKLQQLMSHMRNYYCSPENQKDMTVGSVVEGGFYATLHTDEMWYRILVQNKVDESGELFSALALDFGDFIFLQPASIFHLHQNFRSLPAQAMKAKLSSVQPIHGDWTPEDGIYFNKLVHHHLFVSMVKEIERANDGSDAVLHLQLIDTTEEDKDVYIDKLLIEDNRATAV